MIATAPHISRTITKNREFEYLLLGDLRQILDEPAGPQTSRWLLAILDVILVGHPQIRPSIFLPVCIEEERFQHRTLESRSLIEKLRRLRDRVAHRTGHAVLAAEIREELREVMLDRMSSAACHFDA